MFQEQSRDSSYMAGSERFQDLYRMPVFRGEPLTRNLPNQSTTGATKIAAAPGWWRDQSSDGNTLLDLTLFPKGITIRC
jgi:hypothetical protein